MIQLPLSEQEIEQLLDEPLLGHIAVVRNGKPHVSPIWVYYQKGVFYFTTRLGRVKGRALRKAGRVAVSIATNERPYRAVIVEGVPQIVEEEKWELLRKISTKYGKAEGERWLEYSKKEPDRVALALRPERMLSWHYGKGDYGKQNQGVSMRTEVG